MEASAKCTKGATRGKIMLRVHQRCRMNVGDPNGGISNLAEGVGDAHISDDARKGKSGRSEGALL